MAHWLRTFERTDFCFCEMMHSTLSNHEKWKAYLPQPIRIEKYPTFNHVSRDSAMNTKNQPDFLPKSFMPEGEYQQLYATNSGVDEFELEREEAPIPIDPAMTAEEVYRMLPSSPDFEFGGFITRGEIRYQKCSETCAHTEYCQPCTWHSHPTAHPNCNVPSRKDIYQFLKWRHRRATTVGERFIWVFDKSMRTVPIIRELHDWESRNMLTRMRYWMGTAKEIDGYVHEVLAVLGLPQELPLEELSAKWHDLVASLGIELTIIEIA